MLALIFYDNADSDVARTICITLTSPSACIVLNHIPFSMVHRVMTVKSYRLPYHCEWDDLWGSHQPSQFWFQKFSHLCKLFWFSHYIVILLTFNFNSHKGWFKFVLDRDEILKRWGLECRSLRVHSSYSKNAKSRHEREMWWGAEEGRSSLWGASREEDQLCTYSVQSHSLSLEPWMINQYIDVKKLILFF